MIKMAAKQDAFYIIPFASKFNLFNKLSKFKSCVNYATNSQILLFLKLELIERPRNYVTLVSRITQLSPPQPNHQQEEH